MASSWAAFGVPGALAITGGASIAMTRSLSGGGGATEGGELSGGGGGRNDVRDGGSVDETSSIAGTVDDGTANGGGGAWVRPLDGEPADADDGGGGGGIVGSADATAARPLTGDAGCVAEPSCEPSMGTSDGIDVLRADVPAWPLSGAGGGSGNGGAAVLNDGNGSDPKSRGAPTSGRG